MASMTYLADHFKMTLAETNFEIKNIENESKSFERLCTRNYPHIKSPISFWQRILTYHRDEDKNVCLIAEICIAIGSSNRTVKRGFSKLTTLLTDKRLSMSHSSMENCLLIAANATSFSTEERNDIIKSAVAKYLNKRRRKPSYTKTKRMLLMSEDGSDDEINEVEVAALATNDLQTPSNQESDDLELLYQKTVTLIHRNKTFFNFVKYSYDKRFVS